MLRVPFFVPTIFTIARTDLVLTVPRRLGKIAAAIANVRVVEPPKEIRGFTYFMAWHPQLTTEPAHTWFRDELRMVVRSIPVHEAAPQFPNQWKPHEPPWGRFPAFPTCLAPQALIRLGRGTCHHTENLSKNSLAISINEFTLICKGG